MCDVGVPMHANGKRGVRHILLVKWSGGSLYLSRVSDIVDVFDEMSKAGVEPNKVHVYLKQHEMKDLPENDDAIAQWCRDIYVAKLLDKHIAEDTFGEEKLQDNATQSNPL
ncbi:hypothetical protein H5410_041466 [Solanum commersonii]|uniref:Acyltransferase C-terminal domain-containing protein n=1 Tax=Solanum commersonii TaxID=4109 RepID=A0A9J5XUV2_SOLCO|nr:hypothetical protein H5410_041466 [Solanum commersonii]